MLGPIITDIQGYQLTAMEREILCHPNVGGVILFSRNYTNPEQLRQLVKDIKSLRSPQLVIMVDQEGGPVQRFAEGFTILPELASFGRLYDKDPQAALNLAQDSARLMASELLQYGVDLSLAPVVDINTGKSPLLARRALHANPDIVVSLANAYIMGMRQAGMAAVAKHFPGHGSVTSDSHYLLPTDSRDFAAVNDLDLRCFSGVIHQGVAGVMPAHILFPNIDDTVASLSAFWLQNVLRQQLNFSGVIICDDLNMEAAKIFCADPVERTQMALNAGVDLVLYCNDAKTSERVIEFLPEHNYQRSTQCVQQFYGKPAGVLTN